MSLHPSGASRREEPDLDDHSLQLPLTAVARVRVSRELGNSDSFGCSLVLVVGEDRFLLEGLRDIVNTSSLPRTLCSVFITGSKFQVKHTHTRDPITHL